MKEHLGMALSIIQCGLQPVLPWQSFPCKIDTVRPLGCLMSRMLMPKPIDLSARLPNHACKPAKGKDWHISWTEYVIVKAQIATDHHHISRDMAAERLRIRPQVSHSCCITSRQLPCISAFTTPPRSECCNSYDRVLNSHRRLQYILCLYTRNPTYNNCSIPLHIPLKTSPLVPVCFRCSCIYRLP